MFKSGGAKKIVYGCLGLAITLTAYQPSANAAANGAEVYKNNCMKCHGLNGNDGKGPKVVGEAFSQKYPENEDIYQFVKLKMPKGAPGSLKDEEYIAVSNYIAELNGRGAGHAHTDQNVKVLVDGKQLAFPVDPIIKNGTTLVPLREIFAALGASVAWDGNTKTVTSQKGANKVILTIGKTTATANGKSLKLTEAAQIIQNKTFVPLRFVSDSLGAKVEWNGTTKTVTITTK